MVLNLSIFNTKT